MKDVLLKLSGYFTQRFSTKEMSPSTTADPCMMPCASVAAAFCARLSPQHSLERKWILKVSLILKERTTFFCHLSPCAPCATCAWYEPQCVKMPEDVPPWWGTRKPLDLLDVEIPSLNLCTLKIAKQAVFKRVLMHKEECYKTGQVCKHFELCHCLCLLVVFCPC